jgi:hypothetical protein
MLWARRAAVLSSLGALAACVTALTGVSAAAAGSAPAAAHAPAAGGTWGTAAEVPGTAALNKGGGAAVNSVSCASAGNCSAGGYYTDGTGHHQAFVASEVSGTWHSAIEVPGTAALNVGGGAEVNSVSCASAGNCSAGGYYIDSSGHGQPFVVSEKKGAWGKAEEVPGIAALNKDGISWVNSVSCASAGNCSAGGFYRDAADHDQAFVASQVNGTWHSGIEVPGTAAVNQGSYANAEVTSVSCRSAGNCTAGGYYTDSSGDSQAFVASEVNGTWRTESELPGTTSLEQSGGAGVNSVSCASAGNCSVAGYYINNSRLYNVFVASEVNGTWRTAIEVPGIAALSEYSALLPAVSCASAGNCSAGGYYTDSSFHGQAFVVSEVKGTWQTAIEVPGTAALNVGGGAQVNSVSCASAGNCSAVGSYANEFGHAQAFVTSEVNGTWQTAIQVTGATTADQDGSATAGSVSCASPGNCSAGGYYIDSSGNHQAFTVGEN